MRQEEIAQKVGKSRAAVANSMRLLDLDQQVQTWVVQGLLSVGHAKVLLGLKVHGGTAAAGGESFAPKLDRPDDRTNGPAPARQDRAATAQEQPPPPSVPPL